MGTVIDFATRRARENAKWSANELARIRSDPAFAAVEFQRLADNLKKAARKSTFPDVSKSVVGLTWIQLECAAERLRRPEPEGAEENDDAEVSLEDGIRAAQDALQWLLEPRTCRPKGEGLR